MSSQRFLRRPECPKSDLDGEDWRERIDSLLAWIENITTRDLNNLLPRRLHVGAIWGPRGSGKTSLLYKVFYALGERKLDRLRRPTKNPEPNSPEPPQLFAPDLIDDSNGEHLLAHILTYLQDNLMKPPEPLKEALTLLTEHAHQNEFLAYEKDVAPSTEKLKDALTKSLSGRAVFSSKLRESITASIQRADETQGASSKCWRLVLIDDIDLVPHRGPELLDILHTYLRDCPIIVLLAADREQFIKHLGVHLAKRHGTERHQNGDIHLAYQVLAKQVPYEWNVPQPDPSTRLDNLMPAEPSKDSLEWRLQESFSGKAINLFSAGWLGYRARLLQERAEDREMVRRGTVWRQDPSQALLPLLPLTWRGVNRTFNRLATLVEEYHGVPATPKRYSDKLRCGEMFVIPLLIAIIAVDEQIPELALWDALNRDPEALFANLPRALVAREPAETSDEAQPHSNHAARAQPPTHAPLDRLCSPWLAGREQQHARAVLIKLAEFWEVIRAASITLGSEDAEAPALSELYAISVSPGANARDALSSDILAQLPRLPPDSIKHIDLRAAIAGDRPTANEIQALLHDPRLNIPDTAGLALFARAPLSLMAWLGWNARQRLHNIAILAVHAGLMDYYGTSNNLVGINRSLTEPQRLERPFQVSFESSGEVTRTPHEVAIILDIRGEPDMNSRAHPFLRADAAVVPEYAYKFTSNRGFIITPEDVNEVLGDVCWLFQNLRDNKGIQRFHVAFATSSPMAFFIGRQLHAFTPVELYEYDPGGPAYRWVASLT